MLTRYVWYACYGSNINYNRFLCYIDGIERTICEIRIKNAGCSDKSQPIRNKPYNFKHSIYFANNSKKWDGGVAFIDLNYSGFAYGRIYLITEEQFSQVRDQEGCSINWYGYPEKNFSNPIDEVDGIKVYTFTQKNNKTLRTPPSKKYKDVIISGLLEIGLNEDDATKYLDSRI